MSASVPAFRFHGARASNSLQRVEGSAMGKVRRDLPDVGICEVLEDTLRNVDPSFGTSRTSVLNLSVSSSQTVRKAPSISLRAKEGGDGRGAYLNFGNERFSTV